MQFAIDPWGKKIGPAEGPWGYCPECGGYVTALRRRRMNEMCWGVGVLVPVFANTPTLNHVMSYRHELGLGVALGGENPNTPTPRLLVNSSN